MFHLANPSFVQSPGRMNYPAFRFQVETTVAASWYQIASKRFECLPCWKQTTLGYNNVWSQLPKLSSPKVKQELPQQFLHQNSGQYQTLIHPSAQVLKRKHSAKRNSCSSNANFTCSNHCRSIADHLCQEIYP